jgi:hypothetical protein
MTNIEPTPEPTSGVEFPSSHFTKAQRQYFYGVVAAGVPILAGISTQVAGNAQLILLLVAAILGLGGGATAASNTVPLPKA